MLPVENCLHHRLRVDSQQAPQLGYRALGRKGAFQILQNDGLYRNTGQGQGRRQLLAH